MTTTTERLMPLAHKLAITAQTGTIRATKYVANELLDNLNTDELTDLLIILARMIQIGADNGRRLRPCGTHAAYIRHKTRGEPIDLWCLHAERAYQRARKRAQRRAA